MQRDLKLFQAWIEGHHDLQSQLIVSVVGVGLIPLACLQIRPGYISSPAWGLLRWGSNAQTLFKATTVDYALTQSPP